MNFSADNDSDRAREALARAPDVMARNLSIKLDRAAEEVAREMREQAPKAFSNLVNSIRVIREDDLSRLVAPGVNYARYVEDGTQPGTMPPWENLTAWLKQKAFSGVGRRFIRAQHGDELRDRAFGLAHYIKLHGTRAQSFVAPTAQKMQARVIALLREGVDAGIKEALG